MTSVLDMILEQTQPDRPPQVTSHLQGCARASVLICFSELLALVSKFLQWSVLRFQPTKKSDGSGSMSTTFR